eukprot:gene906-1760_t
MTSYSFFAILISLLNFSITGNRTSSLLLRQLRSLRYPMKPMRRPNPMNLFSVLVTRPHAFGIVSKCDWIFYHRELIGDFTTLPKLIYVQSIALPIFGETILPAINFKFVLISGGNDRSVPRNLNPAFGPYKGHKLQFNTTGGSLWEAIVLNPYLIHWFAENKDMNHPMVSTMPTGMNPNECQPDSTTEIPTPTKSLNNRPFLVLQIDRVRNGKQAFQDRKEVEMACRNSSICQLGFLHDHENGTNPDGSHKDLSHPRSKFLHLLVQYPFVMCVHGGGIDPSPKAWEAIRAGTIPIILNNTLLDAYTQLPVAFVNNFTEFLYGGISSMNIMKHWLRTLGPYYEEGSALRNQTLYRLSAKYWFHKALDKLSPYYSEEDLINNRYDND